MTAPLNGMNAENYWVKELTRGVMPTNPTLVQIPITGGMPALVKESIQSEELNSSREITAINSSNRSTTGEFAVEYSVSVHDEMIAAAMSSSWTSGFTKTNISVVIDSANKTFTRSTGSYVADGVLEGDLIYFSDATGNNATPSIVTAVTATVVTCAGLRKALTDETVTTDYSVGDKTETGSECATFSIYTVLSSKCGDTKVHFVTTGVEFTGWSLENAISSQVSGSFPFIGGDMSEVAGEPSGATLVPVTTNPYTNKNSSVVVDGELIGGVTSISYTNDNNASGQYELNDDSMSFVERGKATNTISASMFMYDAILFNKYKNDTEISTHVVLTKNSGEALSISTPRTFLDEVTPETSAQSHTQSVSATAIGSKTQSSIVVQRLPNV